MTTETTGDWGPPTATVDWCETNYDLFRRVPQVELLPKGQAVKRLREEPSFAQKARELQARLDETDGTGTAARLIAWLAQHKAPLRKPEGNSRSLTREAAEQLLRAACPQGGSEVGGRSEMRIST